MQPEDPVDSILDELVDRAMRGEAVDVEACVAAHPELAEIQRERLRGRARALVGESRDRTAPPPAFEQLGDFRVLAQLGTGGMGVVYVAQQLSLGRKVALKVMRPELLRSASALRRFEREAHVVAQLRHPNIVAVHSLGEDRGVRYLVMDLIDGQSLDEVLRDAHTAVN